MTGLEYFLILLLCSVGSFVLGIYVIESFLEDKYAKTGNLY